MRSKLSFICTSVILSAALLVGCEVNLPIKEMADAKAAISLARYYQADKYAPDEIKAADDALLLTHDNIKIEKEKESIAAAADAKAKAVIALEKALPLLAKDTIDDVKKLIAEAKGLYSDEFAAEDTGTAERLIADADKSYTDKSWIPAYENAVKARVAAASARDKSLARIPALKSRLDELKAERDSLKNQNAAAYASNELASLDTELTKAEAALAGNSIKDAVVALKTSSELVDKINLLGKSALAQEKINRAESSLAQIKASPYAADVAAKTTEAETKTSEAKAALAGGKPDDASTSADEALGIIDGILIELAKKDEEAKNVAAMKKDTETVPTADTDKQSTVDKVISEAEDTIHYIVQWRKHKTDCLWRIAEKLYSNARLWPVIYMANRDKIKDPDLIYPGQKLVIPPAPKKKKAWELDKPIPIPESKPESVEPEKNDSAVKPDQPADRNEPAKKNVEKNTGDTAAKESSADKTETAPSDNTSDNAVEPTGDTEPPAEDTVEEPTDSTDAMDATDATEATDNGGDSVDGAGGEEKDAPAENPDEATPPAEDTAPAGDDSSHNDYNHDAMTVRIAAADSRGQIK